MTAGLIDVAIAMDSKVELLPSKDKALIHGRKQQVLPASELVDRHGEQAVIPAGVAGDDGSVAIGSGLVGADDLPFQ